MAASAEQLLHAVQIIESQLTVIKQSLSELGVHEEGHIGTFDGEAIILEDGRRQVIPPNYASKSMLVPGDTLRMTEDPSGGEQPRFKQISKVERSKATGLLTRKDGKFEVICEQGSFKVLAAAIKHFEGEVGDQVTIQFAKTHLKGSWAAVEKVIKTPSQPAASPSAIQPVAISHQAETVVMTETQPAPTIPAKSSEAPAATIAAPAPAATQPRQAPKSATRSKSRSGHDNRPKSSAPVRSSQPSHQPVNKPAAPVVPTPTPQPLAPSQGEIVIPAVMDDDELA